MPEEIRGLSVKFDADFSEFKKGMKSAEKDINSTQKQLKDLQSSLNLKWDNKKFAQAQQQAQKALEATEQKAELLRNRLSAMEAAGVTDKTRDEYNYLSEQLNKAELNAQKLENQLKDLDEIKLQNLTSGIDKAVDKLDKAAQKTKGLSTAATAAIAGLTALTVTSIGNAAALDDLAQRSGISAEKIQELQYVAMQTGVETNTLTRALIRARAAYADLGTGNINKQAEALTALGISYGTLNQDEIFDAVIIRLSEIEDETLRVAYANEIFSDRIANELVPMLNAGSGAILELREEFHQFDNLSNEQVSAMAAMDDELNRLKKDFSYLALQMASDLLPVFSDLVKIIRDNIIPALRGLIDWFTGLDESQQKTLFSLLLLLAGLSPALKLLSGVSGGISTLIKWLAKLDKQTLLTYGKWVMLAAAVGSLFSVLANWSNMNTTQRVIGLLGALAAAALSAAVAFGVFHSAWSIGLAVAGIVAGIAAATAAVKAAGKDIGADVSFDTDSYKTAVDIPSYNIPEAGTSDNSTTNNTNNYVDNSNVVINIEKNEYMTEDDIIRAVNKGLKQAKQSRT